MDLAHTETDRPALASDCKVERERAWRLLYQGNFDRIYRLVCRLGVAGAEVEDVVQQVFTIAFRKIDAQERVDNPNAWLYGIAIRVVRDHHRWRRVRRLKQSLLDATVRASAAPPQNPEAETKAAQTHQRVAEILQLMSPKLREVLVLSDIEECGPSEVADVLGIPVNTVRSRKQRARVAFQALWEQRHGKESQHG